jgi:Rnl2 family RNA ligase
MESTSFTKYPSIKTIHHTRQPHRDEIVYITEKVHGSNFQICVRVNVCGDVIITYAKRSGPIADKENFFNYRTVMKKYEENLSRLVGYIRGLEDFSELLIMGELYGGHYHGQKTPGHLTVQKSKFANYSKENDFIVFDIVLNNRWFTWDETIEFCTNQLQMNHVPEFARGKWGDLKRSFDVESTQSLLSHRHNGDDGEDNPIEGVVVRSIPVMPHTGEGMDTRFKWKAREMCEGNCHDDHTPDTIESMMNEPRFQAYLSKVGPIEIVDGNTHKHIKEMVEDVFADITDAQPDIDAKTLKSYRKPLSNAAHRLIFNYKCLPL